ncbi:MAG: XRE family transcriptional regulator [Lachnospiraceae bacterium]|nr:XRE family transcriptional regulator [Lachnospiraceae bacterium]
MNTLSKRLSETIKNKNISQSYLSKLTGINKGTLNAYITGKYVPKQKNLSLISKALGISPAWLSGKDPASFNNGSNGYINIPVLGYVAAGIPNEAIENIVDFEEIPEEMAKKGSFFGLVINGDSMEPRIIKGDVVIVRKQPDVESGEIAIVFVKNEATCKKLLKSEKGISLIPFNSKYTPVFYTWDEILNLPVTILGKVVELRGKF